MSKIIVNAVARDFLFYFFGGFFLSCIYSFHTFFASAEHYYRSDSSSREERTSYYERGYKLLKLATHPGHVFSTCFLRITSDSIFKLDSNSDIASWSVSLRNCWILTFYTFYSCWPGGFWADILFFSLFFLFSSRRFLTKESNKKSRSASVSGFYLLPAMKKKKTMARRY